ncbi:MAG: BamA/TamA family outer membrane protein [Myxococcaceae bacterium]|nr:BamA/TamA family outer membrane protein [Myxococcaceae bacterium]
MEGLGVPLVSYNSDFGLGYGAAGGMYIYGPGHRPYRHAISAQLYRSTRGVENHFVRYDGPGLIGPLRVEARLELKRELRAPFFGVGNVSSPDFNGNVEDPRFSYERRSPGVWARLRHRPLGEGHPFEAWAGYSFRWMRVRPYAGSVLAEQAPVGLGGGPDGQLLISALWDTRDNECDATRGGVEEVAVRLSHASTGSRHTWAGVTLTERRFLPISSRLILAQRFTVDVLTGEVPFWELANIGGSLGGEGLGGMSTLRGVPRNRYVGKVKVLSNTELRWRAIDFTLFGQDVSAGGLVFADVGRVWHPDVEDGHAGTWHPGVGAGIRLSRRAAVARVDVALDTETLRKGLYITFGHMF